MALVRGLPHVDVAPAVLQRPGDRRPLVLRDVLVRSKCARFWPVFGS